MKSVRRSLYPFKANIQWEASREAKVNVVNNWEAGKYINRYIKYIILYIHKRNTLKFKI